jgi:hypothetical protein
MKMSSMILGFLAATAFMTNPVDLSAKHHSSSSCEHQIHQITFQDVSGTFQISGFSNSLDGIGSPSQPQSEGVIGQAAFYTNGTGFLNFIDFTAIIAGNISNIHEVGVPFTYTVGPLNGYGTVTIQNFPVPGQNIEFALSFKMHKGKVDGFSMLNILENVPSSIWILLEGNRFN